ncbi:unnamed protein product, partial [Rotaria socialis]
RLNLTELQKISTTSILIHKNCDDKVNFDYRPILNNNSTNNNHNDINYNNNKATGDVKLKRSIKTFKKNLIEHIPIETNTSINHNLNESVDKSVGVKTCIKTKSESTDDNKLNTVSSTEHECMKI